jgi:hypothetical protein
MCLENVPKMEYIANPKLNFKLLINIRFPYSASMSSRHYEIGCLQEMMKLAVMKCSLFYKLMQVTTLGYVGIRQKVHHYA